MYIKGDKCHFRHDDENATHNTGACYDCGETGYVIGDDACKKPGAALNFPGQLRRYKRQRSSNGDPDLDGLLSAADDEDVRKHTSKKLKEAESRIAILESNVRILSQKPKSSATEETWKPVY